VPNFKMPTPIRRPTSDFYWIRKKVPLKLRPLVGKTEVWASLGTKDERKASIKIGAVNAAIEAEWARLRAGGLPGPASDEELEPAPFKLSHQDLHALRGAAHLEIRDAWIQNPPTGFRKLRLSSRDEESLHWDAEERLEGGGYEVSFENIERLKPLLIRARNEATKDVERALTGDYRPSPELEGIPRRTTPALDFISAFEEYAVKGGLKGGKFGPTAKRWRPKIRDFCEFIGHRDLKRLTTADGYKWIDHLIEKKYAHRSIKNVWIAALSATAGFMVERRRLDQNPFLRMTVREDRSEDDPVKAPPKEPPRKGFTAEEAKLILTATLATPSHLTSVEMRAARRWLPWLCAYSGARVNELTSLHPSDISPGPKKIRCMVIKPSLEKTAQWRVVPIHSHVIAQGFLKYVEEREKLNKPLFYDPDRSRGGKPGNPQFKKVAERIGEWVHGLGIPVGVKPNHAWRHLFKSVARHVKMDREVEGFITGHRPKDSNAGNDYGDRWIKTMAAEIEKYPRFRIAALKESPAPHKRRRRTDAEVAAARAEKEGRKATPASRATPAGER
jgi:integrase